MRWIFLAPFVVLSGFCFGQEAPDLVGFQLLTQNDSTAFFLSESPFQCWQDAQDEFVALGGHLATFSSLAENTEVWNASLEFSPFPNVNHWIGLIQLSEVEEPSGNWSWVTGEALTFANWAPNEPNDTAGIEEFGIFSGAGSGTWNDMPNCSSYSHKAILEIALLGVVYGCSELGACNYDEQATSDDGSCEYATCLCLDGTIWSDELGGCIPATTCPQDLDYDGVVGVNDLMNLLSAFGTPCEPSVSEWTCGDPVSYHGYDYETVLIGEQCWFAENCRYLPYVNPSMDVSDETPFAYVYGFEGCSVMEALNTENFGTYGALYNYSATLQWEICPTGWHIPTDAEWGELESSIGLSAEVVDQWGWRGSPFGDHLKSISMAGNNSSAFNALPAGRTAYGIFSELGNLTYFWSSTLYDDNAMTRALETTKDQIHKDDYVLDLGISVRCIKD